MLARSRGRRHVEFLSSHCIGPSNRIFSWIILIVGAPGTLYEGEHFKLEFHFTPSYPLESPEVLFIKPFVPIHPQFPPFQQIYSNGHICLNILYRDWSPVQTVAQVCLSIQSMLSSCTKKASIELPPDNDLYVKNAKSSPKKTSWAFQ
ncbi:ubiquitin-conjugating enzyme/RWD-like protein [Umbelopsis sp. AD052]|nr:ubiquitin-conjugating enzyme/RWD-like protein [Umbelopsis sp. AD052]